uniref:F-box associated domain-containing protein n=1 Tax=Oryza punctata TaxID=4537 RepID=A0A0E0M8X4_ORYPU
MAAWPEPDMLLRPSSIAPLTMHDGSGDDEKKIIFRTDKSIVFGVDLDGIGTNATPPEILLKPEDAIAMAETHLSPETTTTCSFQSQQYPPGLGLFEESLVLVGRTFEEIVFSSPVIRAWSEVLKWLPARTVSDLSLVRREWCAMVTTNRFIRSHAIPLDQARRLHPPPPPPRVKCSAACGFTDLDDLMIYGNRPRMCTSTPFICSPPCHGLNLGTFHRAADIEVLAAYANGKIYWVVEHQFRTPPSSTAVACELLVFDVEARKFEAIQGPPCRRRGFNFDPIGPPQTNRKIEPCHRHGNGRISLLELHGALCVACSDPATAAIDMWMVKDDGAWSVEYRLEIGEFSPEYPLEATSPMAIDPSVARFRSVSRSWRAMLSSAPFVQLHLRRASRPGQLKVFFHSDNGVNDVRLDEHYF